MNQNVPTLNFIPQFSPKRRLPLSPLSSQIPQTIGSPKLTEISRPPPKNSNIVPQKPPILQKKRPPKEREKANITQPGPVGLASHDQVDIHVHVGTRKIQVEGNSIAVNVPKGSSAYQSGERLWKFSLSEVTTREADLTLLLQQNSQRIFNQGDRLAWLVGSEDRKASLKFICNFFSHLFIQSSATVLEASVAFVREGHLYNGMDFPLGASEASVKPKRLKLSTNKQKRVRVVGLPTAAVSSASEVRALIQNCESNIKPEEHIVIIVHVQTQFGEVDLQVWYLDWPERGIHCDRSLCSFMDCIRVIYENRSRKKPHVVPFRNNVMTRLLHSFLISSKSKVITQINLTSDKFKTVAQALSFCCIKSSLTGSSQTKNKFQLNRRMQRGRRRSKKQSKTSRKEEFSNEESLDMKLSISESMDKENDYFKPIQNHTSLGDRDPLEFQKLSSLPLAPPRRRIYRDEISDCSYTSASSFRSQASLRTDTEFDNLRSILESTRRSLSDRDSEIRELRSQLGTRAIAFDNLSDTLDEVTTAKAVMLQRKDSTISLLQRRIATLEQELAVMTRKHQVREDEVADLMMQSKRVIEVLVEELNLLGETADVAHQTMTSMELMPSNDDSTLELWSRIRSSLLTDGSDLPGSPKMKQHTQKVIQSLYNAMNILLKTIQLGQQEKIVLNTHSKSLEEKMEKMRAETESLRAQLLSMESKMQRCNDSAEYSGNQWRHRVDELLSENSAYRSMLEALKGACQHLDPHVDLPLTQDAAVDYWKEQVAHQTECMRRAAAEMLQLRAAAGMQDESYEMKELQSYLQESEYKRGRLKVQHEKIKAKMKIVDERRMFLEKQAENLQRQIKVNEERFEKDLDALRTQSSVEMAANINVLKRESSMKDGLILELENQLEDLEEEVIRLESKHIAEKLPSLQSQVKALQKELSEAKTNIADFSFKDLASTLAMEIERKYLSMLSVLEKEKQDALDLLRQEMSQDQIESLGLLRDCLQKHLEHFSSTTNQPLQDLSNRDGVEGLCEDLEILQRANQAAIKELISKNQDLEKELKASENRLITMESTLEETKVDSGLRAQGLQMKLRESQLQNERVGDLETKLSDRISEIQELETQISDQASEIEQLRGRVDKDSKLKSSLESWVEQLQSESTQQKTQLSELKAEKLGIMTMQQTLKEEVKVFREEIVSQSQELASSKLLVEQLEREKDDLLAKSRESSDKISHLQDEVGCKNDLEKHAEMVANELANSKTRLEEAESELSLTKIALQSKVDTLDQFQKQIDDMASQLDAQAEKCEDAKMQIDQSNAMKEGLESLINELQDEIGERVKENRVLETNLDGKVCEIVALQKVLDEKEAESVLVLQKVQKIQSELPGKLQAARSEIENLRCMVDVSRRTELQSKQDCADLKFVNSTLNSNLNSMKKTIEAQLGTILKLNETNECLLHRVEGLKKDSVIAKADYELHLEEYKRQSLALREELETEKKMHHTSRTEILQINDNRNNQLQQEFKRKNEKNRAKIFELLSEVQEVTADRNDMKLDLERARESMNSLQEKLNVVTGESNALRASNESLLKAQQLQESTLKSEMSPLQSDLKSISDKFQLAEESNQALQQKLVLANSELRELTEANNALIETQRDLQNTLKRREAVLKAEISKLQYDLQSDLQSSQDSNSLLREKLKIANEKSEALCEEKTLLLEKLNSEISKLQEELVSVSESLRCAREENDSLQDRLRRTSSESAMFREANQSLTDTQRDLQSTLQMRESSLTSEIATLESELKSLSENLRCTKEDNVALHDDLANASIEAQKLREANQNLTETQHELESTLQIRETSLKSEISNLQYELETVRESNKCLLETQKSLQTEVAKLEFDLDSASEDMLRQKRQFDKHVEELRDAIKEKRMSLASMQSDRDKLRDLLEEKSRELMSFEDLNQNLTMELAHLRKRLESSEKDSCGVQSTVRDLEENLLRKEQTICALEKNYQLERSLCSEVLGEIKQAFVREDNLTRTIDNLIASNEEMERLNSSRPTKIEEAVNLEILVLEDDKIHFLNTPSVVPDVRHYPIDLIQTLMESSLQDSNYMDALKDRLLQSVNSLTMAKITIASQDELLEELESNIDSLRDQDANLVDDLNALQKREIELLVELETLRADQKDAEEEIDSLSNFICSQGLGNYFLKQQSDEKSENTDGTSSDEPLSFNRLSEAFTPCESISEGLEDNPMECEVDYLSRIHQLEHDIKTKEEEVQKWRAWKLRADIHGKRLAETLIESDRGAYTWQKRVEEQEEQIESLTQQLEQSKNEALETKELLLESNQRFSSVQTLMEQEFKDLFRQNTGLQNQLEKCQKEIANVSEDKLESLNQQLLDQTKENESTLISTVHQLLEENSKTNNLWAVRHIHRICRQIDVIMCKKQATAFPSDVEAPPSMTLVDAIEILEHKVTRIQEAKEKYTQKQRQTKKRRDRHRHYLRGSPGSTPPSKSEPQNADQNCSIS